MSYNQLSNTTHYPVEDFYSIIDNLKRQNILPQDSFLEYVPFFNLNYITKESQVMELFNSSYDSNLYKSIIQKLTSSSSEHPSEDLNDQDPELNMMTFAQICLYKVLPCPDPCCSKHPREIVTHNQYKDFEFECPFYHHERDRRRPVASRGAEEDFDYKANYYEEGRNNADKAKYSQNYFESMFHPLYYKMFRCKREYCNANHFCPFYHEEQEKKTWDRVFNSFIKKDRITYVKDKQKYYESTTGRTGDTREQKSPEFDSPNRLGNQGGKQFYRNNYQRSPNTFNQKKDYYNPEGRMGKGQFLNKKNGSSRKSSDEGFGLNGSSYGVFNNNNKQILTPRVC